ncbi:hypothetical protein K4F52_000646 [Lecanicillium sp. MT-2017a]|nr:hypothetical protein K4F52_000646 [Lecanicillium sp. MT-2017a]
MTIINVVVIAAGTRHGLILIPISFFSIYSVQYYYLRTARQLRYLEVESKIPLYTYFSEIARGMEHIRALNWEDALHSQLAHMLNTSQKAYYYSLSLDIWLGLVLDLCVMGFTGIMITLALCFPSTTSQAAIGLSLINLLYLSEYALEGILSWTSLESSLGSLQRTREFITKTPLEPSPGRSSLSLPEAWPRHGRIDFSSVTSRYSTESAAKPVFRDISFTVYAGQKVGIVGRTGSGKTSMLLTILNMLNVSGAVSIDGILVADVEPETLRSRIVTVPQDGVYLDGTIRENIDPYSESPNLPSDETLMAILQRVGLAEYVKSHGGLDEDMPTASMSQGQRQLLCIARAILRKETTSAKIVLLDEATGSMDNETGERIHGVMSEAFADCTVITVAHRLQALNGTDLVFNMEDGKITKVLDKDSDEWKTWEEYTSREEVTHQDED